MTTVGSAKYTYEPVLDFPMLPEGETFGVVSTVATDSQDRLYVYQRKDPPFMVFDKDGTFLNSWGNGAIESPHGMTIAGDVIYVTDREGNVVVTFTLDGKPLLIIGERGKYSDTGCETAGELVPRASGPLGAREGHSPRRERRTGNHTTATTAATTAMARKLSTRGARSHPGRPPRL